MIMVKHYFTDWKVVGASVIVLGGTFPAPADILYYDTNAAAGLQPGNVIDTTPPKKLAWAPLADGTGTRVAWNDITTVVDPQDSAYFQCGGTSVYTCGNMIVGALAVSNASTVEFVTGSTSRTLKINDSISISGPSNLSLNSFQMTWGATTPTLAIDGTSNLTIKKNKSAALVYTMGTATLTGNGGSINFDRVDTSAAGLVTLSLGDITKSGGGAFSINKDAANPTFYQLKGASANNLNINTVAANDSLLISALLASTSMVNKNGLGTLMLTAANNYTGATTVNAGTLVARSANALGNNVSTNNVTVAENAGLKYAAAMDAQLLIGGTLGVTGGTGTSIGGSIGSTATSAQINVTGAATLSDAPLTVNIFGINAVTPLTDTNTYTLLHGNGSSSLNPATPPQLGIVYNNTNFTVGPLTSSATDLNVEITSATVLTTAFWQGGLTGATNIWAASNGSSQSNWVATSGGANQALTPGSGADVTISNSSVTTAPTATVLGADMTIKSLIIADTTNGLGLDADGYALTITPDDPNAGITVNASVPASSIAANLVLGADQTWTNDSTHALTVSGIVSGANALTKAGAGAVVLGKDNTYTGGTTISGGSLQIGNGGITGSITGTTGVTNDAALVYNRSNTLSVAYGISGSGSVTQQGSGILTISGANTYTGTTTLSGGMLNAGVAESAGVSGPFGVPSTPAGSIIFGGGTLQFSATNQFDYSGRFTSTGNAAYSIDTNERNVVFATGLDTNGSSGLAKQGAGTLTLSGANTYTGNTTVDAGTLTLAAGAQLMFVIPGTSGANSSITGAGTLVLNGDFNIDTATNTDGSVITTGSWMLENVASLTGAYGGSFRVVSGITPWAVTGDTWTKTVGTKVYTFDEVTGTLTLSEGEVTTTAFEDWALLKGLDGVSGSGSDTDPAPTADPDNDGSSNLVEFGLDGNPRSSANDGKVVGKVVTLGADNVLTLTLPVRVGATFSGAGEQVSAAIDGIIYHIQGSDDLVDFTTTAVTEITGTDADDIRTGLALPGLSTTDWEYRTFRTPGSISEPDPQDFLRAGVLPE